ncbi:Tyrosinase copper-binding domain-containing protein [Madurella fahalii]|uniref:Tyrosinase copper-binding domain-containing protein n=1 Tax=Madurella fahalii TaxID=1157608 RepID=A0ABQ0GL05_9PEZI
MSTAVGETGTTTLTATYDEESQTWAGEALSTVIHSSKPSGPTEASSAVDPIEEDSTSIPDSSTVSQRNGTTSAGPNPTTTEEKSSSSQPPSISRNSDTASTPAPTDVPDEEWTATSETSLEASSTTQGEQVTSQTAEPSASYPTFRREYPADILDELRDRSIPKLATYLAKKSSHSKRQQNACTLENARVRREWGDLSLSDRAEYIAAVQCLMKQPPQWPPEKVPGARSRFDDFVAAHIFNSSDVHGFAHTLFWHRYYVHAYERALRDECGYTGAHPYWNFDRWAEDPKSSPLFDGSATSLGGDGNNSAWGAYRIMGGPFAGLKVNLGPGYAFDYNPRFVRRYISHFRAHFTTTNYTYPLVTENDSLEDFQMALEERLGGVWRMGMATIYSFINEVDMPSWVADPVSFLFHASIDRLWWLWQLQDLDNRLYVIQGMKHGSWQLEVARLNDTLNLGYIAEDREVREVVDTMDGPFCYIYY